MHPRTMGGGDRGNEMAEQSGGLYSISLTLGCLMSDTEVLHSFAMVRGQGSGCLLYLLYLLSRTKPWT